MEQLPSVDDGLPRTERQALRILQEQSPLPGIRLFFSVQRMEEQIFMGDTSFYRMMAELSAGPYPLVEVSGTASMPWSAAGLGTVTITDTGRMVIEGRADQIELNGIDSMARRRASERRQRRVAVGSRFLPASLCVTEGDRRIDP